MDQELRGLPEAYVHHFHGYLARHFLRGRALSGFKRACYDPPYSSKRPVIKVQAFHVRPELKYFVQVQPLLIHE